MDGQAKPRPRVVERRCDSAARVLSFPPTRICIHPRQCTCARPSTCHVMGIRHALFLCAIAPRISAAAHAISCACVCAFSLSHMGRAVLSMAYIAFCPDSLAHFCFIACASIPVWLFLCALNSCHAFGLCTGCLSLRCCCVHCVMSVTCVTLGPNRRPSLLWRRSFPHLAPVYEREVASTQEVTTPLSIV